jgi:succinoglycan biosynthesis transport protein ExoP
MSIRHNVFQRARADVVLRSEPAVLQNSIPSTLLRFGDFKSLFATHWRFLAFASLISLIGGFAYTILADQEYSAAVKVRVDLHKTDVLPGHSVASTFLNIESALLEGDVDLARSVSVLRVAASRLNLDDDPDFNRSSLFADLRASISGFFKTRTQRNRGRHEVDELRLIALGDRTRIDRIGQSLLIRFVYRSSDPYRAARVANTIAEAFINAQALDQKQAISKITASLHDRLGVMREEVAAGETAVARYKSEHVLTEVPGGSELERQLVDLNNQAAAAKAEAAALGVRLERLTVAAKSSDLSALTNIDHTNQALSTLVSDLKQAFAQNNSDVIARTQKKLENEIESLLKTRRVAFEFAEARATQLTAELERVKEDVKTNTLHHVQLAVLQRHAESKRVIYQATSTAFNRFVQNEALPPLRFAIVEEAVPPALPHWPKPPLVMTSMLLLGLGVGSGYILLREGFRQTFRSTKEISEALGFKSVAVPYAPLFTVENFDGYDALLSQNDNLRAAIVRLQYAVRTGSSAGLVVGCVSAVKHEGKSSITGLLGSHIASLGMRVLLVDTAASHTSGIGDLSRRLNTDASRRRNGGELAAYIHQVTDNVHLLSEENAGLCSFGIRSVFSEHVERLRGNYDIVIVDLPGSDEAQHLGSCLDKTILVTEWNYTTHDQVLELFESAPMFTNKLACVVLNKVQWQKIRYLAPGDYARLKPSCQSGTLKYKGAIHEN